jgi:drug/metabolite transporter (DMT)-like permease
MATLLLVTSAFLHALWNALAKKNKNIEINLMGIMAAASFFGLAAIPFFPGEAFPHGLSFWWALAAGLFEAGYMVTLVHALNETSLGLSYTIMRGGAMVIVWFISIPFLNEPIHIKSVFGILLVLGGLILSNIRLDGKLNLKQVRWSYLCALFIAGYHLSYGRALDLHAQPASLFAFSLIIGIPLFFYFSGRAKIIELKNVMKTAPSIIIIGGAFCAASFIIFLIGLKHSGAGYAITLRNTSIIFAQILSLVIGEKLSRRQIAGAAIVFLGAALLTF